MGQNEFKLNLNDLRELLIVVLLPVIFVVISLLCSKFIIRIMNISNNEVEDIEIETEVIDETEINTDQNVPQPNNLEVEDTELENEIIEERQIVIDPNAPPPGYDEIEFVSTAVPKQNVILMNSLPAYEDIYKGSFC